MSLAQVPSMVPSTEKISSTSQIEGAESNAMVTTEHVPPRTFSLLAAAGLGFTICNTGLAVAFTVSSNVFFGGSSLFFWGFLLMIAVGFCVAVTLGELASAYPSTGGQYVWVALLAPRKSARFLSHMTGTLSWASVVCVGASACAALAQLVSQLVSITHPDFAYHRWLGFLVFEAVNATAFFCNIHGRSIPKIEKLFLFFTLALMIALVASLLAPHTAKQSARQFFLHYYNVSGWSDGIAFFIGINGVNWGFSCLDAVTHLAEEIPDPRKNIPKALIVTVAVSTAAGLPICFAIFFAATDVSQLRSIFDLLYILYNQNTAAPLVVGSLFFLSGWGSVVGCHTWQARIAWALSRDNGFAFSSYLSRLSPEPLCTPMWAHTFSVLWIGLCGVLFLVSSTAFNSLVSASILLQYLTYSLPTALLLWRGRSNFSHGPFWYPRLGPVANVVLLAWTLLTLVFYSFPYFLPVAAAEMNYVSVVLVLIFIYAGVCWMGCRKNYKLIEAHDLAGMEM